MNWSNWRTTLAGILVAVATAMMATGESLLTGIGMVLSGIAVAFGLVSASDAPKPPTGGMSSKMGLLLAGAVVVLALTASGCADLQAYDAMTHANLEITKARYVEDVTLASGRHLGDPPLVEADFPVGSLTWTDYSDTLACLDQFVDYEESKQEADTDDGQDAERDADE